MVVGSRKVSFEIVHEVYCHNRVVQVHAFKDKDVIEGVHVLVDCEEVVNNKVNQNIKEVNNRIGIVQTKLV